MSREKLIEKLQDSILYFRAEKIESTYKLTHSYDDINKIHAGLFKPLSQNETNFLKEKLSNDEIESINKYFYSHQINKNRPDIGDWGKPRFLYNIVDGAKERLMSNKRDKNLYDVVSKITPKGEETQYWTTYSFLKKSDWDNVDKVLKKHLPETFKNKSDTDISEKISEVYQELDYLHARWDGNSRTNRTYVSMLGKESGFTVKWNEIDRQEMYLSRDKSLAEKTMSRNYEGQKDAATAIHVIEKIEEINKKNYDMKEIIKPSITTNLKTKLDMKTEAKQSHTKEEKEYKTLQQKNVKCRKLR